MGSAEESKSPKPLTGWRIGSFESRRQPEMSRLIEKFGGTPFVSPSMREIPADRNQAAIDFANNVMIGGVDVVVILTGVGFRYLVNSIERYIDKQRFLNCLQDIVTIARGPKPTAVLREFGLQPTVRVPEPNTWREILQVVDQGLSVANLDTVILEYGKPNPSLTAGLEARGAIVESLSIYRWALPEDTAPLQANIERLIRGELDVVMLTSAQQLINVLDYAGQLGLEEQVRAALLQVPILSIGPTTSEALRENGFEVAFEPSNAKMGNLVAEFAEKAHEFKQRSQHIRAKEQTMTGNAGEQKEAWYDGPFMKACRGEPTSVTPVWLMRQAGRYMQEYRQVRAGTTFLELCKNPQLCSEVMCTAVNRLGVDAAIIFSDLLPILEPMGLHLEFEAGEGPVIHNPVRVAADVDRVRELTDMSELDFVMETVRLTRRDLPAHLPLIGFAGAPFTLASYLLEGGSSRSYIHTKRMMYADPGAWRELMERLTRTLIRYLNCQAEAGAQCLQIFDSWVGALGPDDYRKYVLPYMKMLIGGIKSGVPVINFGTGNPELMSLYAEGGGDVIGVDWRIRLDDAWKRVGKRGVQGNLDPTVLLADQPYIETRVKEVLGMAGGRPGHIFNLGHGVLQQTPVENAIAVVKMVHDLSTR